MARIESWFDQDLKQPVKVRYIDGNVFSQDNKGNLIGVNVFSNGEPVGLNGTISASVIRADGETVAVTGSYTGNSAYVILPQAAYVVPGVLSVVIKHTDSQSTLTLCAVVVNVYRSATDSVVDPGTIIPSIDALIAEIEDAVASIPPDYSALSLNVANLNAQTQFDFISLCDPQTVTLNGITFTVSGRDIHVQGQLNSQASYSYLELYSGQLLTGMKVGEEYYVKYNSVSEKVMFGIYFFNSESTRISAIWPRHDRTVTIPQGTATIQLWILVESHDTIDETVRPELISNYIFSTIPNIAKQNDCIFDDYTIGHISLDGSVVDDNYLFVRTNIVDSDVYNRVYIINASNHTFEWFKYTKGNSLISWGNIALTTGRTLFLDPGYHYRFQIRKTTGYVSLENRFDLITEMLSHIIICKQDMEEAASGLFRNPAIIYRAGRIENGEITDSNQYFIVTNDFVDLSEFDCIWIDNGYRLELFKYQNDGTYIDFISVSSTNDGGVIYNVPTGSYKYRLQLRLQTGYTALDTDEKVVEMTTHLSVFSSDYIKYKNSPVAGKTWNAVGDSITENGLYMQEVYKILPIEYTNHGLASSTIAINNEYLQNLSIVERVCGLNGNTPYSDADVWTINGGLNDVLYKSDLGELASIGSTYDNTTVYGALQTICEYIMNLRAHPRLVLMTPTHSPRDNWSKATYGITIDEIRKAFFDVGALYGIAVLDLWAVGGINNYNSQKQTNPTTTDGTHPNSTGASLMAPPIADAILKTYE